MSFVRFAAFSILLSFTAVLIVPFVAFAQIAVEVGPGPATGGQLDQPDLPPDATFTQLAADPLNLELLSRIVLNAIVARNWGLLASVLLAALLAALRRWIPETTAVGKWLQTKLGILITNFSLSLALMFGTLFAAGGQFNVALVLKALTLAVGATGSWSIWKNVKEAIAEKQAAALGAQAGPNTLDK